MKAKVNQKGRATGLEVSRFHGRFCRDCPEATIHQTGSTLWISCRFQSGWRDINSTCNLPEAEAHS